MDNNYLKDQNLMLEAMKIAATPAGKQLMALLQKQGGNDLQNAMEKAAAGDISQAQKAIASLLDNPEAKKLLEQLGR